MLVNALACFCACWHVSVQESTCATFAIARCAQMHRKMKSDAGTVNAAPALQKKKNPNKARAVAARRARA